jgi:phospholipase/carboxylesterase
MHKKEFITAGLDLDQAAKVLIMVHGRGGSAGDILSLSEHFTLDEFALLAPQATGHSWYPNSFLAPQSANEPWLSSALELLSQIVEDLKLRRFGTGQIYFLGFSQGACLTLEFIARNATRYGGVVAFTGGLIGEKIDETKYGGRLDGTPIFVGTSDPDPHVPVERVMASTALLEKMGAAVTRKIYKGMGHTINQDEVNTVNELIFSKQGQNAW